MHGFGPAGSKSLLRCSFRRRTRLWRTSTDMQNEMSSSPTGGLRLPAGKHTGILIDFQTEVNKKTAKN